jgi:hypothetical protein
VKGEMRQCDSSHRLASRSRPRGPHSSERGAARKGHPLQHLQRSGQVREWRRHTLGKDHATESAGVPHGVFLPRHGLANLFSILLCGVHLVLSAGKSIRGGGGSDLLLEIALIFSTATPGLDALEAGGRKSESLDLEATEEEQQGQKEEEGGKTDQLESGKICRLRLE